MDIREFEIREKYKRLGIKLCQKSSKFTLLNSNETWESLSQYGYVMAFYPTKEEAEKHILDFYKSHMNLIRQ